MLKSLQQERRSNVAWGYITFHHVSIKSAQSYIRAVYPAEVSSDTHKGRRILNDLFLYLAVLYQRCVYMFVSSFMERCCHLQVSNGID